jgi:5-methylcytosine-specific restriction endonuclease McrA
LYALEAAGIAQGWAKAFYNSKAWKQEREYILKRDRYLCQCAGCHALATEVHHKKELTEDNVHNPMIALNPSNLMSVCSECHKRITKAEHRRKGQVDLPNIVFDSNGYPIEPPRG